ncbi:hypothetical protein MRX96_022388 [Rhipicephalus microplus]
MKVAPQLSSIGRKSLTAFNGLHDGKTRLYSPSHKGSFVESQQTVLPQQSVSLPPAPSGKQDSKNDSASNFQSYSVNRRSQPSHRTPERACSCVLLQNSRSCLTAQFPILKRKASNT